jgi:hypothetical protein
MSFLSLFPRRVVHVRVHENPFPAGGDETRLALYTIRNHPHGLPFKPRSFRYSDAIKKDVRGHLSWISGLFVVVKIWRADGVTESPKPERYIGRTIALLIFLLTVAVTAVSLFFLWVELQNVLMPTTTRLEEDDLSPAVLAVLNGNVATAGATAAAIIGIRALKFSEPFETTTGWVACHLGPVVLALILNLALLQGWFGWDTAAIKAVIAPWALIASIAATAVTAGFSTLRWTAIEEIQRQKPVAREVADWLLRQKVV